MAAKKEAPKKWEDQKVRVKLFKDGNKYKEDVTVVVNGTAYRIKRGVPVDIPAFVWQVLKRGMEQDVQTATFIEKETEAVLRKEKELGL